MVVDTTYYVALGVKPNATELEIKKAYRKLAITTHPDKNPGDETAHTRFQAIGEAYQVLSNEDLRKRYDQFGIEQAVPGGGFEDPVEFFGTIFGGESFIDLIGELSLMRDLTKTLSITDKQRAEEEAAKAADENLHANEQGSSSKTDEKLHAHEQASNNQTADAKSTHSAATRPTFSQEEPPPPYGYSKTESKNDDFKSPVRDESPAASGASSPRRNFGQMAIMDRSEEDARMDAAGLSPEEKELRRKEKRKGLSREQRAELAAYEAERKRIRDERVDTLAKKLLERLSIWTETDKGGDVTKAFQEKTRLEVENLKMESFGIEILHAIGNTYLQKATSVLKSQKFLGISGFFSRLKDKGTLAKDTWSTISTALDAQMTIEEMAKLEEKGGEDWTDEKKAEYEKRVTGKILAAAWKGSRFEIQSVLREVCDKILNDKNVKLEKRIERAHALVLSGTIFQNVSVRPSLTHSACNALILHRLNETLMKRGNTWLLSSSWPKRLSRKTARPARKIRKRRKRNRRKRRRSPRHHIDTTTMGFMGSAWHRTRHRTYDFRFSEHQRRVLFCSNLVSLSAIDYLESVGGLHPA